MPTTRVLAEAETKLSTSAINGRHGPPIFLARAKPMADGVPQ